ncbi:glycosyl transferase family 2 [bacterium BMS3Abin12]|nr:glycosyl transferase family 2 [bacterium BMS3Abin12]
MSDGLTPGTLRVRYAVQGEPVVSLIVETVDDLRVLERFVDSVRESTQYPNLELVVVDRGSEDEDTEEYFDALRSTGVVVVRAPTGVRRAEAWNVGASAASGEFLLFADRRVGFVRNEWLATLLGQVQRAGVGIAAPRIVGADGKVVHSAFILGFGGPAKDAFQGLSAWDPGYAGRALTEQGCSAVPPGCLMVRRSCFEALKGFDAERFPTDWFTVDFCLRSEAAGYRTVWTPYALVGWQGSEPARETSDPDQEAAIYERWLPRLARDPFYHRNLDLSGTAFQPRMEATARWNPVFHDRPRILGVPADTFGCGEYRILAPLNALDDAARAQCGVLAPQEGAPRMPSVTELARLAPDTLLLQGALDDVHLEALRRYRRFNEVFCVFDMEDLKTNIPKKNSRRPFMFRNIKARTRRALALCDRLTVTTEPLAEAYRDLIEDIRVVPVYLARERWAKVAVAANEGVRPRVGWAGGQQHQGDLEILLPVVEATAREVDWVFFGMCPDALRPYVKEVHDMVPFAEYPARLGSLALDLAVAPLEEHPFNVAKTNLRLLEYGILGWPVVGTDIEPYRGAPVVRVPNAPDRWIAAIRERVHDLDAARAEGARLRDWVLGGWMLEDHLDEWMGALSPGKEVGVRHGVEPERKVDARGN